MNGKRFAVVLSDIHIGSNETTCWYQRDVHESYLTAALEWIVSRREAVREVILLGDIFDTWTYVPSLSPPSMHDIIAANRDMLGSTGPLSKLVRAIPGGVQMLLGNHDGTLTASDIAQLNASLGGDVSKGEAIELVECPILVLRAGGADGKAVAFTHGHHWCMFNSPDDASPWRGLNGLPVGHIVSRAIAYRLSTNELAHGGTAADLPNMGNPSGSAALAGFIGALLERRDADVRRDIVKLLLGHMAKWSGLDRKAPIRLPDGKSTTTIDDAEQAFGDLYTRWATTRENRDWDTDRAGLADVRPLDLTWFAQRVALQTVSDLVVMGHTHTAVGGLMVSPIEYVNNGYACVSRPDLKTTPFTFTVVDIPRASAQVYKVAPVNKVLTVSPATAREAPRVSVIRRGLDYSCYLRIMNRSGEPLSLSGSSNQHGVWSVSPPAVIADGARADIWLQDEYGVTGADGSVTYQGASNGSPLTFSVACPTHWANSLSSPVPDCLTRTADRSWRRGGPDRTGHPLQVRCTLTGVRAAAAGDGGAPVPTAPPSSAPGTAGADCFRSPVPGRNPTPDQERAAEHADYVVLARQILNDCRIDSSRGKVMSHAWVVSRAQPLINTDTKRGLTGNQVWLSDPPRHLMSPQVFQIYSDLYGPFEYVLLQPTGATAKGPAFGGFLFLPSKGSPNLHLVSFNIGEMVSLNKSDCSHDHHAEMQIMNWVKDQTARWWMNLGWLTLDNRSRANDLAFSPCNFCATELAAFLTLLNDSPRDSASPMLARMSWANVYNGFEACGHPLRRHGVELLTKAGWELQGPLPDRMGDGDVKRPTPGDPRWPDQQHSTR